MSVTYTPHPHLRPIIEAAEGKKVYVLVPRPCQLKPVPTLMMVKDRHGRVEYTTAALLGQAEAREFAIGMESEVCGR